MQYSDIKSEVAYKVGKRESFERQDRTTSKVKTHIDVAEIMKQKDRDDMGQEHPEELDAADPAELSEGDGPEALHEKHEAKEEDEEENALSTVLDFLSTFIVTLRQYDADIPGKFAGNSERSGSADDRGRGRHNVRRK